MRSSEKETKIIVIKNTLYTFDKFKMNIIQMQKKMVIGRNNLDINGINRDRYRYKK